MSIRFPLAGVPIRAARWSATHPWRAIGLWLGFVVVAVSLAATVPTVEPEAADYRVGESGRAEALIEDAGLGDVPTESVLITSADGGLDAADATAAADDLATTADGLDGVAGVADPVWNEDRSALLLAIELDSDEVDAGPILDATTAVQDEHPGLDLRQAGDVTVDEAIDDRVAEDLASAEVTSLPITLILMLVAFGALIAAGLPVLLGATSVAATIGVTAVVSHLVPAEPTINSMIVVIGMAVGVDYSLFYLKREREEREAGRTTLDAVAIAAETSGHAILVSGAAVIASLAGLFVMTDVTFTSLATGSIIVVGVAMLGSLTVLPALLVKLGRWVDRPRVPGFWRLTRRIGRGGISNRVLAPVIRRPLVALLAASAVVGAIAVPALGLKTHSGNIETLPADIPAVQAMDAIADAFPSEGTSASVVVTAAPGDRDEVGAALGDLSAAAAASGDFVDAPPAVQVSEDGGTAVLDLALPYAESDERAEEAIEHLRSDLVPDALGDVATEHAVGGDAASAVDYSAKQGQRMPLVIGFVLLLTMLMMAGAFRSLPIALLSTALNLASVGVAFGLLSLVFQHGWGESLLDFTSPGFVIDWIPLFVMVVLVGLSMDYHVFVLSRVREHLRAGLPTHLAVQRGIADSAGVVTSAAAVMVSVFAIFATLSMLEMKMMGVGLAAAILVDATLIRLVILPAALVLMGDRAWWPDKPATAAAFGSRAPKGMPEGVPAGR